MCECDFTFDLLVSFFLVLASLEISHDKSHAVTWISMMGLLQSSKRSMLIT